MSQELRKEPFTRESWHEVQGFACGEKPYQKEVSDWLKGPNTAPESALQALGNLERPLKIWLYKLDDSLVGFGALGKSRWRWKGKSDPWIPISTITWYGVNNEYKRKPDGPREEHYSYRILEDLIAEAEEDRETHPVLGLNVDKANERAIDLYIDIGFTEELSSYSDGTGSEYRRLAVVLDDEALKRIWEETKKKK